MRSAISHRLARYGGLQSQVLSGVGQNGLLSTIEKRAPMGAERPGWLLQG